MRPLLIAGDVCPISDHTLRRQRAWLNDDFASWLGDRQRVQAEWVVYIAGNHDFALEARSVP